MVFFYSRRGQLSNRIWQAGYFIANSIENNYTFLHLGFGEYAGYFSESIALLKAAGKCYIVDFEITSKKNRLRIKLANILKRLNLTFKNAVPFVQEINFLDYTERYDISDRSFLKTAKKKIALVEGWLFIDRQSFLKHAETIRTIFKPNQSYIDNVEKLFQKSFTACDLVIGVHIRKGDYASYRDGAWLYSNADYNSFLSQFTLLPSFKNKTIAFLLCSNEEINLLDFEGFNVFLSTNHFIEDMYALSNCDYIAGPPSTFSSWASFYGKTPLLHIDNRNTIIKEEDFKIFECY